MSDLLARLEKAMGPDRQLDLAIHTAIFGQSSQDNLDELLAPEAYTGSVDAALMLYRKIPDRVPSNPRLACIEAMKQWT